MILLRSCADPGNVMRYSRLVTWASDGLLRQEPPVTKLNTCMDDTRTQPEDNGIVSAPSRDCRMSMRSEEHTSELQSLMRTSYAVFCLKKKNNTNTNEPSAECRL